MTCRRRSESRFAELTTVMSSNIKPKPPPRNRRPSRSSARSPAACARIARKPELEVSFAAERPGLAGGKARLPEPPRKLIRAATPRSCAGTPIPWRCGSPATIRRCTAGWRRAASRRARCSRRSSRRASRRSARGACRAWRSNLGAMLEDRFHRGKFDDDHRPRRRADRGRRRADGARAPDRPRAAAGGAQAGRSVARLDRGEGRRASSTGWSGWSRTSAASATSSTTCSTRSTWPTSARATRRTTTRTMTARTTRQQNQGEDGDEQGVRRRRRA